MGITEKIAAFATACIASTGYAGVFLLMALESMIAPVPSEAVMPFAGFLIADGTFSWFGVILASTLGSIVGSLISYYLGYYGGRPLVLRVGKYFLLDRSHLELTERYFGKHGDATILISRFIPVVRHLISIPAGLARMHLGKFVIYTILGAALWNTILAVAGYYLKNNWSALMKYSHVIDIVVVALLAVALLYVAGKLWKDHKKRKAAADS